MIFRSSYINRERAMKLAKVLPLGLFVIAFLLAPGGAWAQTGTITGMVTDSTTGTPLPGVNVIIEDTQWGAATNAQGIYTISGVEPGTYTLRASFIGYSDKIVTGVEVRAGETTTVDFALVPAQVGLDEVVVIGYGEQQREDVTGAVATVDLENVQGMPLTSPDQALQGQVAGVTVKSSSGIPGGGPVIRIRGTGSFGAGSRPLFVVDGFALPQPSGNQVLTRNPLATIPMEDIESITVLKDASATAIYGSRGSNGVVIITTKSGQAGEVDISVSASTSINQVMDRTLLNSANAREFAKFQNVIWQGRVEEGIADEVPVQYRNPDQYDGASTYWMDEITRTAMRNNVHISVSGGSSKLRSYFSAGYTREEGIILNTDYNRFSLRANLEADLSEDVTVGLHLAPTYSIRNLSWEGGSGRAGAGGVPWMACPMAPVYKEDGTYLPQIGAPGYGEEGNLGSCPGVWSQPNPVMWLRREDDRQETLRALGSAFVTYEFAPGLELLQSVNVDYRTSLRNAFRPSTIGYTRVPPPTIPSGFLTTNKYVNWLSETTLNWTSELGPGNIDALVGFTAQEQRSLGANFSGQFPDDEIQTLNVATQLVGTSNEQGWSLLSGLARVNYSLLDRFVFTGTIRSDGSSRFGRLNRWGTFPSAAVAWNIHNESFMDGIEDVSELRLRFSYGITGNNSIGNYAPLGVVQEHNYVFNNNPVAGRILATLGNPTLAWERTREANFGLNASLYEYRLRLSLNLYRSITTNLLLQRELPYTSGFGSVTENLGKLRNQGVELSLTSVNVNREDFNWTTTFNFSLNRNRVLELPGGEAIPADGPGPAYFISREGLPIGTYAGYIVEGLYTPEELANACNTNVRVEDNCVMTYPGAAPGTIQFRDLNGDGVLTPQVMRANGGDFTILGDAYADFTFGLTNMMSIGRFNLRVFFTGSFGNDNLRAEFFRTARNIDGLFNVDSYYVHNMWLSPQQPGDGLTPSPLGGAFGRQQYRDSGHSLILSDASNIWLRNVTLSYNFEGGFLTGSSVYLSASNLFIITPYPDNPNVTGDSALNQMPGVDFGNYPLPRTFALGVQLSL